MNDFDAFFSTKRAIPAAFVEALEKVLIAQHSGQDARSGLVILDVVQAPRSKVLRASIGGDMLAVKIAPSNDARASALLREAQALRGVGERLGWVVTRVKACGTIAPATFLATPWLEGRSLASIAAPHRNRGDLGAVLDEAAKAAAAVRMLNGYGWHHRDLQPAHFIQVSAENYELIDFGESGPIGGTSPYQGALVHFVSPSVARQMLEKRDDVTYTEADEVFAFVATMFAVLFGKEIWNYGPYNRKGFFEQRLKEILNANHISRITEITKSPTLAAEFGWAITHADQLSWATYQEFEARLRDYLTPCC